MVGKGIWGLLLPVSGALMVLVTVMLLAISGGHLVETLRPFASLVLLGGYLVWRQRKMARDPDYARYQAARNRAQLAWWMFFLIVLGGVVLLVLAANQNPRLEQALMPYMEAGPLLILIVGAPLFVAWRMRSR